MTPKLGASAFRGETALSSAEHWVAIWDSLVLQVETHFPSDGR